MYGFLPMNVQFSGCVPGTKAGNVAAGTRSEKPRTLNSCAGAGLGLLGGLHPRCRHGGSGPPAPRTLSRVRWIAGQPARCRAWALAGRCGALASGWSSRGHAVSPVPAPRQVQAPRPPSVPASEGSWLPALRLFGPCAFVRRLAACAGAGSAPLRGAAGAQRCGHSVPRCPQWQGRCPPGPPTSAPSAGDIFSGAPPPPLARCNGSSPAGHGARPLGAPPRAHGSRCGALRGGRGEAAPSAATYRLCEGAPQAKGGQRK